MAQRLPSLWYPEASYAKDAALVEVEEGGRGSSQVSPMEEAAQSKKLPILRRRTPTVVVPKLAQNSEGLHPSTKTKAKQSDSGHLPQIVQQVKTYDTLEKAEELNLLDLSSLPYRSSRDNKTTPAKKYPNWFCGWTDEEYFDLHRSTSTRPAPREVIRLQTPSTGARPSLYNRSTFTSALRRRTPYKFQHFASYEEYAEEYRLEYSYTSLHIPKTLPEKEAKPTQEVTYKIVNERSTVTLPIELKNVYQEDPYFAELVSRLGIKEPPRSRGGIVDGDQNLLLGMKPTPPSIVKKKKNVENIVISNSGKVGDRSVSSRPATSDGLYTKSNTSSPRPSYRQTSQVLPRVTQTTQISQYIQSIYNKHNKQKQKLEQPDTVVNRYLQLRARLNNALLEEDEEHRGMSDVDEVGEDLGEELTNSPGEDKLNTTEEEFGKDNFRDENFHDKYRPGENKRVKDRDDPMDNGGKQVGKSNKVETGGSNKENHLDTSAFLTETTDSNTESASKDNHQKDDKCLKQTPKTPKMSPTAKNCLDLDPKEREKIISDTAYLLGVGSRDWAKTYVKKIMTSDISKDRGGAGTRPPTRQSRAVSRIEYRNQERSRAESRIGHAASQLQSRAVSRMEYRNQEYSRAESRIGHAASQLQSRAVSRMEYRNQEYSRAESRIGHASQLQSRAVSRMGQRNQDQSRTGSRMGNRNGIREDIRTNTSNSIGNASAGMVPPSLAKSNSRSGFQNMQQKNRQVERFQVKTLPEVAARNEKKIEELKSIYKPSVSKRKGVSTQSDSRRLGRFMSRCVSRQGYKPNGSAAHQLKPEAQEADFRHRIREDQLSGSQFPNKKLQKSQNSRTMPPITSITSLDGSSLYWNEIARKSRPPTGKGRHATDLVKVQGLDQILPRTRSHNCGHLAPPTTPIPMASLPEIN